MPMIRPIDAIQFSLPSDADLSSLIAPPYDVLDVASKRSLLEANPHNVVAIDLPHLPAKAAGPDQVYEQANTTFRQWLQDGVLIRRQNPALFIYQQTYTAPGNDTKQFKRCGVVANLAVTPFGKSSSGHGAIFPHEQTFSGPKEDRMKLMCATRTQLSPIFGLYSDPRKHLSPLIEAVVNRGRADFQGRTTSDGVLHEVWRVENAKQIAGLSQALGEMDVFIADGHHRYTTAINYRKRLIEEGIIPAHGDEPAHFCMFVLVAMQDPGMIVLPTHRVLGGMTGFTLEKLIQAAGDKLVITEFAGSDLAALEAALPQAGAHAMGLYNPARSDHPLAIATTIHDDPLAQLHPGQSEAWRMLDVAILQHLIVEQICQPTFCHSGGQVAWKFPHSLKEMKLDADSENFQLGVVMQPTELESVRQVSEAGELMPQKSTFFYPKIATGLVMNPLES